MLAKIQVTEGMKICRETTQGPGWKPGGSKLKAGKAPAAALFGFPFPQLFTHLARIQGLVFM